MEDWSGELNRSLSLFCIRCLPLSLYNSVFAADCPQVWFALILYNDIIWNDATRHAR